MKHAMLVLTLVAGIASAEEIGRVRNDAGGAIVFTMADCKEGGKVAYGYGAGKSDTIWGCATPMDGALFVKWSHGSINRYPFEAVEWSESFKRELKKNTKTY